MSQKKQQFNCKSIVLLGSFLGAAIVSNASAFAVAQAAPANLQTLDSETTSSKTTSVRKLAQADPTATPTDAKPAKEQVAPASGEKSGDKQKPEATPTDAKPATEQVAPASGEKSDDKQKPETTPTDAKPATEQVAPASGEKSDDKQKPEATPTDAKPAAEDKSGTTPATDKQAPANQSSQLSDVSGNWAEPFIKVLTEKGIIAGYPDGTFQPDRPVTRAEFAALVNKAFPDAPDTRAAINFRDVPARFWAAGAIRKATQTGFLAGYPNRTFQPREGIKRIDSLVSFVNGAKITPEGSAANIDELFTDAGQVPAYGRDQLIASAQRCVAVSVSYPEGKTFNPSGVATRADVAAFLHQTLVAAGRLPKLADDSPAQKYIASCGASSSVAKITEQDVIGKAGVPAAPAVQQGTAAAPVNAPVGGVTTPSGFGAEWGDVFVGVGSQGNIPQVIGQGVAGTNGLDSTSLGIGFGLGDARNAIALETSYTTAGSFNSKLFNRGGFNFKLHKVLTDNLAVAVGYENAISNGYTNPVGVNPGSTVYGVVTGVLPLGDTSNITASVGGGNGRFRSSLDIENDKQNANFFGSLGFRASENIALVADYNGRNFNLGLPLTLKLSDGVGVQVTPSLLDIGGNNFSGPSSRFAISGGLGIKF
jgi:hypothetical protein